MTRILTGRAILDTIQARGDYMTRILTWLAIALVGVGSAGGLMYGATLWMAAYSTHKSGLCIKANLTSLERIEMEALADQFCDDYRETCRKRPYAIEYVALRQICDRRGLK